MQPDPAARNPEPHNAELRQAELRDPEVSDQEASDALAIDAAKRDLRRRMRATRLALTDRTERSARLWDAVLSRSDVDAATRVLVFDSIEGEPETASLIAALVTAGKAIKVPEDVDLDPAWPDLIVVPGLAFTADGRRVGQGGGWYDRFLPGRRSDCVTIGVCFAPQLVDDVPTEAHDVVVDAVLTD